MTQKPWHLEGETYWQTFELVISYERWTWVNENQVLLCVNGYFRYIKTRKLHILVGKLREQIRYQLYIYSPTTESGDQEDKFNILHST